MRRHFLGAAGAALALLVRPAAAETDTLAGSRSEKLVERSHVVSIAMDHGHATLVVRRTVHNGGPRHDQATFFLHVPDTAVAVGLRTLGMRDGKPFWFSADLLEAEAAAERYRELTGVGGYYPKDPALLSWRYPGVLALQVFPVAPATEKTVEYTLAMPTAYRDGRDHLVLPSMGTADLPAVATVTAHDAREAVFVGPPAHDDANESADDDAPKPRKLTGGASIKLDGVGVDIASTRVGAGQLDGAMGVIPLGPHRAILRQRIEAAPHVAEVPNNARVVVAIDASRSMTSADVAAEVAAARAYVAHFKNASVEVLTFDREVKALFGGFVPVKKALATLDHLVVTRGNGSRVDDALARAAALFHDVPRSVPRRLVVFTDALTRSALLDEDLVPLIAKTGALVHVAVASSASPLLTRDDDHAWAAAVRSTGGLVWSAGASADAADATAMRTVYEELARPKRIDHLEITIPGIDTSPFSYADHLDEGQGFTDLRIIDRPVGWMRAAGEVWATPVSTILVPDDDEARITAALVFGSATRDDLSEAEMMPVAKLGHAVSPVTSLLAIEPGVRPSTEGLEDAGIMLGRGYGYTGHTTCRMHSVQSSVLHLDEMLRDRLAAAWQRCSPSSEHASLAVESTYDEIVDVTDIKTSDRTSSRCLEDATWRIDLPPAFRQLSRGTFSISL